MKRIVFSIVLAFFLVAASAQQMVNNLGNNHQPVQKVMFTPDGKYLISGGFPYIYDLQQEREVHRFLDREKENLSDLLISGDISSDGRFMVSVKLKRLEIIDLTRRAVVETINQYSGFRDAAISGDNRTVTWITGSKSLVFYDMETLQVISERKLGSITPVAVDFGTDGNSVAVAGKEGDTWLVFFKEKSIEPLAAIKGDKITDIIISPDNKRVAVACSSGMINIINVETRKTETSWKAHNSSIGEIAYNNDGTMIVSGGEDKMITLWDPSTGRALSSWQGHDNPVLSVSFSPDGRMVASGCMNAELRRGVDDTRTWLVPGVASASTRPSVNIPAISAADKSSTVARPAGDVRRLALIVGNGDYQGGGTLANPENDAADMSATLEKLGFDVMVYFNLAQSDFKRVIDLFGQRLKNYDVGLFYYAGHGIQVNGVNYLIPVNAMLKSENEVEYDCVDAGRLLSGMEDAGTKTNIVILDACRDNPFERSWRRSVQGQGLAFMSAPAGSLISYSTSPGRTASDGSGRNGLFTSALLNYIAEPDLTILEMFQKVRSYVREKSGGEQIPWESTSLEGNFYFRGGK